MDAKNRLAAFATAALREAAKDPKASREVARPEAQKPPRALRGHANDAPSDEPHDLVSGSESDPDGETVDVEYIHEHRPATKVVRKFMRVQAEAVSSAEVDDFM